MSIALLSGKPVRSATVLSDLRTHLLAHHREVSVFVVTAEERLPPWLSNCELIVQRALGLPQLSAALWLEEAGVRCCNSISATIAAANRELTVRTLADEGIDVPATTGAAAWNDVIDQSHHTPVVVKAVTEVTGRGGGVLQAPDGTLPSHAPFTGPYVVQEYIPNDTRDYKVYVVGDEAHGLIKWRLPESEEPRVEPFKVDADLAALSRRVGRALRLEIYGVDFVYGPSGPVVVDVNPFPGFRGVPHAAETIAKYLVGDRNPRLDRP